MESDNFNYPDNSTGIVDRVKAIILRPKLEWPVIDQETQSTTDIFTRYVLPLAAIGPIAQLLGSQIFGYGAFGIVYRPTLIAALSIAVTGFVLSLIGLFVISFITDKLAGNFGGTANSRNAFKLVAYSMTATWLAGIFGIIPSLSFLAILGFYSFYLFYTGAGPLMKVPDQKALTYTIVTVICVIAVYLVIAAVTASFSGLFSNWGSQNAIQESNSEGAALSIPGVGSINTGKLEEAARDMESAQNAEAVAPAELEALLPASVGAYQRTAVSSAKAGPSSQAEGTYEAGDKKFTLKVADMAAMGAIAGMAGAFGLESNNEDADSYERTNTVGGNLVMEKWNRASGNGSFSTLVAKRFMIEAEGEAANIDELKAAATSIDARKLAVLAGS